MGRPSVRQQLVEAALEVFQTQGFNGASVQDITEAARVPKGSFYNHFPSKEELALEALKLYIMRSSIDVLRDERIEPLQRIRRHFHANWEYAVAREYRCGCLLGSLSAEISDTHAVARVEFARCFKMWSMAIGAVIEQAQANGSVNASQDPQVLGRFILNAWQGTLVRARAAKGEEPYNDFLATTFDVVLTPSGAA